MRIGILVVELHLEGCHSLKEKRHRLLGLRDRFGKQPNVAVCESDFQDEHQRAQWSFVALGADGKLVEQSLRRIEDHIESAVDAVVTNLEREWL